jgi:hypothetical protein
MDYSLLIAIEKTGKKTYNPAPFEKLYSTDVEALNSTEVD